MECSLLTPSPVVSLSHPNVWFPSWNLKGSWGTKPLLSPKASKISPEGGKKTTKPSASWLMSIICCTLPTSLDRDNCLCYVFFSSHIKAWKPNGLYPVPPFGSLCFWTLLFLKERNWNWIRVFLLLSPKLFNLKPEHWCWQISLLALSKQKNQEACSDDPSSSGGDQQTLRTVVCFGNPRVTIYPEFSMGRNIAVFYSNTNDLYLEVWSWINFFKLSSYL